MSGIYDDGAEYGSDRTNDRRERYVAAILEASEFGLAEEDTDRLADAAMAVADAELDAQPVYAYDGPDMTQLWGMYNGVTEENNRLRAELGRVREAAATEVQWCSNKYEALLSRVRAAMSAYTGPFVARSSLEKAMSGEGE